MSVTGPYLPALQMSDIERAALFYETHLGSRRLPVSPPGAAVLGT